MAAPPLLVLDHFMIFSDDPSNIGAIGVGGALACRRAFMADLRAMGYTTVRLIGHRVSGAASNRPIDLTISF